MTLQTDATSMSTPEKNDALKTPDILGPVVISSLSLQLSASNSSTLEGRACVPFFKNDQTQIVFEFFYLVSLLVIACLSLFLIQIYGAKNGLLHADKLLVFALVGGFLGGGYTTQNGFTG